MGTAALVLGILSLLSAVIGGCFSLGWIGSILAIIAIILGAIGSKDKLPGAKAGLVMGIISLAWGLIATIVCLACIGAAAGAMGAAGGLF